MPDTVRNTVTVTFRGVAATHPIGVTLSEAIRGERPCGGHGKCGKCKVIARGKLSEVTDTERNLLSPEELHRGVRLACTTKALGDCSVDPISEDSGAQIVTDGAPMEFTLHPTFARYGAAIDVGTTTLAARLYDPKGILLSEVSRLNPQSEWGADVISRIESALGGKARMLAESIRTALDGMLRELCTAASVDPSAVDGVAVTGNTVMLSLLTETSVEPFSHAPFLATRLFGETISAASLGLSCLGTETPVYLPPAISAFVGADTTCAILATRLAESENAMLADIGTNGEMALCHGGKLTVCSTAAGPAFEGVGISMGMRGAVGAIDRVTPLGDRMLVHVIGDGEPVGICGSGLVDAAAWMLDAEELDESGLLEEDPFPISGAVSLTQKDVRMLQLAKSAICAGLQTLIKTAGISADEVPTLFVAGGFGRYLNPSSAARIGLLPKVLAKRSEAVGNAALAGASMLLLNAESRAEVHRIAADATLLDLTASRVFSDAFTMGMFLEEV